MRLLRVALFLDMMNILVRVVYGCVEKAETKGVSPILD